MINDEEEEKEGGPLKNLTEEVLDEENKALNSVDFTSKVPGFGKKFTPLDWYSGNKEDYLYLMVSQVYLTVDSEFTSENVGRSTTYLMQIEDEAR